MLKIYPAIKFLRLKNGLTQQQVANKLNCTVPAYSKLETGTTEITHGLLKQLSVIYDMSIREIYQLALDLSKDEDYEKPGDKN